METDDWGWGFCINYLESLLNIGEIIDILNGTQDPRIARCSSIRWFLMFTFECSIVCLDSIVCASQASMWRISLQHTSFLKWKTISLETFALHAIPKTFLRRPQSDISLQTFLVFSLIHSLIEARKMFNDSLLEKSRNEIRGKNTIIWRFSCVNVIYEETENTFIFTRRCDVAVVL